MASTDFEVACIGDWAEMCAHQDFFEAGALREGARLDFKVDFVKKMDGEIYGCAKDGNRQLCVRGFGEGQTAFVEVKSSGATPLAAPLVHLVERIRPPSFVASELYDSEKPVFVAQHGEFTSVLTTQRALSFQKGRLSGSAAISVAAISPFGSSLAISGKDSRGWASAVEFRGLYAAPSVEKLFFGLKAASEAATKAAEERPGDIISEFFGAPALKEVSDCVFESPGTSAADISKKTGLNRYLCRVLLRRLYLEGKVSTDGTAFWPKKELLSEEEPPAMEGFYSAHAAAAEKKPGWVKKGLAAEHAAAAKSLDDLADLAYSLRASQEDLARQVEQLHREIRVIAADSPAISDLSDLKLHMARLDAEVSAVMHRLEALDREAQVNFEALRENAQWASKAQARLSWAGSSVKDRAQKTMRDFEGYSTSAAAKAASPKRKKPAIAGSKNSARAKPPKQREKSGKTHGKRKFIAA